MPNRFPFIVKVCGVTTVEDAQLALNAGANALGFNFYPKSPRFITNQHAAEIIAQLQGNYLRVGVFVNPTAADLIAAEPFLDIAQIHGSGISQLPTWRAITAGTPPISQANTEAFLLDTATPAYGGSGQTFDWSLAANFPYPAIIAGGLDSENVAQAIRIAQPWGVDSCSRLESSPGRKDPNRVTAFIQNAVAAFHAQQAVNI